MNTSDALALILEHVDWTHRGKADWDATLCYSLPAAVIEIARDALDAAEDAKLNRQLKSSIKACRSPRQT